MGIRGTTAAAEGLILAGSGGCMRELAWQIQELNKQRETWNILGYIDYNPPENGTGITVGKQFLPYLGDDEYLLSQSKPVNAAVCVGSPVLRRKIAAKLMQNGQIQFPNLILGDTRICEDVKLGRGCIISMGVRISTNVTIGDFVFYNTASMSCHDGQIGDFVTLGPDVKLAGAVCVGENTELGIGTRVIQGVRIGKDIVTGAGSVIIRDIPDAGTYAGVPAQQLKRQDCCGKEKA